MPKKPLKNLRTGVFLRTLSVARLGLSAGASAAGDALTSLWKSEEAQRLSQKARFLSQAGAIARELGELKGSLMKAGQMLSIYGEHFLPAEANEILRTLQSDSPPVEWKAMEKVLTRQLGSEKLARLEIDPEPVGAASLGQVHRARVRGTGHDLALKIQYPGVDRAIDGDLKALRRLLSLAEFLPKVPATDQIFDEVRAMLKREVNYELERESLAFFARELKGDSRYAVPEAFPEFSSKRVLAMSFEEGIKLESAAVERLSQARRDALATSILDLYFRELFVWRAVQTDPHFGNFRVRLGKEQDQLVLLDFGAVRELAAAFMQNYARMLHAMLLEDRTAFEATAEKMGVLGKEDTQELRDLFFELCRLITEPFGKEQPYAWEGTELPQRVSRLAWELVKRFPLRSPPRELVFLDRKMAGVFTLMAKLRARVDGRALLLSYLER